MHQQNSEEMHYWNNPDGDGQSLSDCASDIFDDDMKEVPAEPTPEKKKRPPRKKKKKQTVPMETAKEEDENEESAVADADDKTQSKDEKQPPEIVASDDNCFPTEQNTAAAAKGVTENVPDSPKLPQARPSTTTASSTIGETAKDTSLNPNAKAWTDVSAKHVNTNTSSAPRTPWALQTNVTKQQMGANIVAATVKPNITATKPVAMDTYKPKPGTWASMAVKKDIELNSYANHATRKQNAAVQPATATTTQHTKLQIKQSATSADWRNHVVSPRRSPYRKAGGQIDMANVNSLPPPPVSHPQQQAWPSLDEFGPPLGAKKVAPKQTKPIGVWGSKPL